MRQPDDARSAEPLADTAGMSDEVMRARTGKDWREWVTLLDAAGAIDLPHGEITRLLAETHGVPSWWTQMVAVGYERIRGLRAKGQRRDGTYEISKSKTLPVPVGRLFRAFKDRRARQKWLPGVEITVRTSLPDKSIRMTWEDGTSVEAYFAAKGDARSQVAVQHRKLASAEAAAACKEYWAERLKALADTLR